MAERKSLGLFREKKDMVMLSKESKKKEDKSLRPSDSLFTLDEMKKLIESLGGDTRWIEKIPVREKELKKRINDLQEEIERYKDELYKLGLLKKALGI